MEAPQQNGTHQLRPKRRASQTHFFKYQLAQNPSKVEEEELKMALIASLQQNSTFLKRKVEPKQSNLDAFFSNIGGSRKPSAVKKSSSEQRLPSPTMSSSSSRDGVDTIDFVDWIIGISGTLRQSNHSIGNDKQYSGGNNYKNSTTNSQSSITIKQEHDEKDRAVKDRNNNHRIMSLFDKRRPPRQSPRLAPRNLTDHAPSPLEKISGYATRVTTKKGTHQLKSSSLKTAGINRAS